MRPKTMAALKKQYLSQTDIPEALRPLYRQDGARWVLDLDADDGDGDGGGDSGDTARKLAEFRENNRKMARQLEELRAREAELTKRAAAFGDADVDQVQEALALLGKLKDHDDASLIKAGRIDEVIQKRMRAKEQDWTKQLEAERTKAQEIAKREQAIRERAAKMTLEQKLRRAIAEKKLRLLPSAEEDLLLRASRDFRFGDDLDADPEPTNDRFSSLSEYIEKLPEIAPHYFDGGGGGGAGSGGSKGGRMQGGVKVLKRSEIPPGEYANALADQAAGKVKVVNE